MKATVFGGSGFLGSHICDKLTDNGYDVVVADLHPSKWLRDNQTMMLGSITDMDFLAEACRDSDIVLNFAGIADLGDADSAPLTSAQVNVMGNVNILETCRILGIDRYIFASSLYVYGKHGGFYRCSKQACELYIEMYHQTFGIKYSILRYGSLYGPRSDKRNGIYSFVNQAMNSDSITYYGSENALREYIHVEDASSCTLDIVNGQSNNDNIILTGSQQMRIHDLFSMIAEMLGKKINIKYMNNKENNHYDVTPYSFMPKIGKKMHPALSIDLGQGILNVMDEVYHNENILQ